MGRNRRESTIHGDKNRDQWSVMSFEDLTAMGKSDPYTFEDECVIFCKGDTFYFRQANSGTIQEFVKVTDLSTYTQAAVAETITGAWVFNEALTVADTLKATGIAPMLHLSESDATADEGDWWLVANGDVFQLRTRTDAGGVGETAYTITRTGTTVDTFVVTNGKFIVSDATETSGTGTGSVQIAGGMYVAKKLYAANTTITQAQGAAFMCSYALTDTLATAWEAKHIASFSAAGVRKGTIGVVKTATDADGDFSAVRFAWTPSTVPDNDSINDYRAYLELGSLSAGSGADYWEIGKDATASAQGTALLWGDMVGNVIIGGGRTKATSAVNVLHVLNGTAPSAALANGVTFYSKDWNGAGTAVPHVYDEEGLSGPLVKVTSEEAINIKYIDIGDWDMDATVNVSVAHNLTASKIRSVEAYILSDDSANYLPINVDLAAAGVRGSVHVQGANIYLDRLTGGGFDSTAYDSTSFNRGYIRVEYTN